MGKKGDTIHRIAAYYYCGYANLWDHIMSATTYHNNGQAKVGNEPATLPGGAIGNADTIKVNQTLIIPIMKDARVPTSDGKPGGCPGDNPTTPAANATTPD